MMTAESPVMASWYDRAQRWRVVDQGRMPQARAMMSPTRRPKARLFSWELPLVLSASASSSMRPKLTYLPSCNSFMISCSCCCRRASKLVGFRLRVPPELQMLCDAGRGPFPELENPEEERRVTLSNSPVAREEVSIVGDVVMVVSEDSQFAFPTSAGVECLLGSLLAGSGPPAGSVWKRAEDSRAEESCGWAHPTNSCLLRRVGVSSS
mmetsp:Transcript_63343/g.196078  ORF Transcript_63343/g.196078 Transcript_63343/m.196078 type:complete len:209 (+) Transcript_63343:983-1609(+)